MSADGVQKSVCNKLLSVDRTKKKGSFMDGCASEAINDRAISIEEMRSSRIYCAIRDIIICGREKKDTRGNNRRLVNMYEQV